MALVTYSDSEHSSDDDLPSRSNAAPTIPSIPSKKTVSKINTAKPSFQRVVDRSQPHRIKVSLPVASVEDAIAAESDQRASKRPRRVGGGGGLFSDFNSLLPAPKRMATGPAKATGILGGRTRGNLASGVSLKTGATPGFSREPEPEKEAYAPPESEHHKDPSGETWQDLELPAIMLPESFAHKAIIAAEPPPPPKKSTIFKPLSVARKSKNQRVGKVRVAPEVATSTSSERLKSNPLGMPPSKPSLFSLSTEDDPSSSSTAEYSSTPYKPLLYDTAEINLDPSSDANQSPIYSLDRPPEAAINPQPVVVSSLAALATDLNLSRSAKRQLLGRTGTSSTAQPTVLNFDIDKEYAANNILRQTADAAPVQPVRAIAPGKHSLKQLLTAASGQKEALEESFASGRRNRKEAGSKYGW